MPELRRCRSLLPAYAKINRLLAGATVEHEDVPMIQAKKRGGKSNVATMLIFSLGLLLLLALAVLSFGRVRGSSRSIMVGEF